MHFKTMIFRYGKYAPSGLFAILSGMSLSYYHLFQPRWLDDIFFFLLLVIVSFFIFQALLKMSFDRRDLITAGAGLLFALLEVLCGDFIKHKNLRPTNFYLYLAFACLAVLSFTVFKWLYTWLSRSDTYAEGKPSFFGKVMAKAGKFPFLFFFAVIVACWVPTFIACFPGIFAYDGPSQIYAVLEKGIWSAHHPVAHTALLSGCFYIGQALFGSFTFGLGLYSVVCCAMIVSIAAYTVSYLYRSSLPLPLCLFALLFFALNPILQQFAITTTKDALFSAFVLLVMLLTVDLLKDPEAFFRSKWSVVRYIFSMLLMCLSRNQGIYMTVLLLPFMVLACKRFRLRSFALLGSCIAAVWIFQNPISTALGIASGSMREALSVPIQQLARVMNTHADEISDDDKRIIYEILPEDIIRKYDPFVSDPVKDYSLDQVFKENPVRYMKVYAKLGLRFPGTYINAFLYHAVGYVYIGDTYEFHESWTRYPHRYPPSHSAIVWMGDRLKTYHFLPMHRSYLNMVESGMFLQDIPLVSLLVSNGFPFALMLFTAGFLLRMRRYRLLVPLVLLFGLWGTLILGPTILIRYSLAMTLSVPVVVSLFFLPCKPLARNRQEENILEP